MRSGHSVRERLSPLLGYKRHVILFSFHSYTMSREYLCSWYFVIFLLEYRRNLCHNVQNEKWTIVFGVIPVNHIRYKRGSRSPRRWKSTDQVSSRSLAVDGPLSLPLLKREAGWGLLICSDFETIKDRDLMSIELKNQGRQDLIKL